jgi:tRNA 2-thiouridine synthesizing protein C
MQSIAIIQTKPPFNQAKARESLDLILALAAVDHQLSVIFSDDAVYQLLPANNDSEAPLKAFQKSFGLFALYEIEHCLVCAASLAARGLSGLSLPAGFLIASETELKAALASAQQIIRC